MYYTTIQKTSETLCRQSLEPIFTFGKSVAHELMTPAALGASGYSGLESLSVKDFESVGQKMKGFLVTRDEVVYAEPDTSFWSLLAATKGSDADREFFRLLKWTYRDGAVPIYISLTTDYSGCTVFGTRELTDVYAAWLSFHSQYPQAYVGLVAAETSRALNELESTCACGDKASVLDELNYFITKYPNGATTPHILTLMEKIRLDPTELHDKTPVRFDKATPTQMRYNCTPG